MRSRAYLHSREDSRPVGSCALSPPLRFTVALGARPSRDSRAPAGLSPRCVRSPVRAPESGSALRRRASMSESRLWRRRTSSRSRMISSRERLPGGGSAEPEPADRRRTSESRSCGDREASPRGCPGGVLLAWPGRRDRGVEDEPSRRRRSWGRPSFMYRRRLCSNWRSNRRSNRRLN